MQVLKKEKYKDCILRFEGTHLTDSFLKAVKIGQGSNKG